MSEVPAYIQCRACGATKFRVQRVITVYQSVFIHAVEADGTYEEDGDELGDTLETENFDAAECYSCGAVVPLHHLFPTQGATGTRPTPGGAGPGGDTSA